jgi:hypothetical protein
MDPHDLPGIHVRTAHTFAAGGATDNQDEGEGFDAYHGSPHAFEKFDPSKIGTGEGAQSYGHGIYFAENEGIADDYRKRLSSIGSPYTYSWRGQTYAGRSGPESHAISLAWHDSPQTARRIAKEGLEASKRNEPYAMEMGGPDYWQRMSEVANAIKNKKEVTARQGHLYRVRIKANPEHFLDWDAPLSEQHLHVQRVAREADISAAKGKTKGVLNAWREGRDVGVEATGKDLHHALADYGENSPAAAQTLHAAGIPGIKYWDAGSRAQGQGTRNYVLFNPDIIHVKRRYADGGLIQDEYPTHYMPHVGRQVMANGGDPGSDPMVQKAMDVAQQTQPSPVEGAVGVAKKIVRRGAKSSPAPQLGEDHPAWIPQRLVTSKKTTAPQGKDVVDLAALKSTPELYGKNVDLLREYPNVQTRVAQNPSHDAVANHFIDHVTDNLLALHDMIPEEIRNRSKLWYEGANKIAHQWAKEYNLPVHSVAGVLAALSPQKDWYQNVSLAKRVLETMRGNGGNYYHGFPFNEKMHNTFNNIEAFQKPEYQGILNILHGKTLGDLDRLNLDSKTKNAAKAIWIRLHDQSYNSPSFQIISPEGNVGENVLTQKGAPAKLGWGSAVEISKAIRSIEAAQDPDALSQLMGEKHKVRNFYNNILSPNSRHGDVTIDTHAVAAGLWRPLTGKSLEVAHNFANSTPKGMPAAGGSAISGVQGTYPLYAEAYRRAAAARGILPREMQSITWEAIRGMFPEDWKTKKNMAKIDDIWNQYRRGRVSAQDARSMVHEAAGGIQHPSWFVGGVGQPNEGGRSSGDAGTLPESGVYGAPTGTTYARARGGIATLPSSGPGYSFDQKVRQDPATILRALALSRSITKGT